MTNREIQNPVADNEGSKEALMLIWIANESVAQGIGVAPLGDLLFHRWTRNFGPGELELIRFAAQHELLPALAGHNLQRLRGLSAALHESEGISPERCKRELRNLPSQKELNEQKEELGKAGGLVVIAEEDWQKIKSLWGSQVRPAFTPVRSV